MPTPATASDLADTGARPHASWAGVPAEARRAERRVRLLDAAFDLLGTEGAAGTTVRAICQSAHLNPRYFYESFADLDQLLVAVYDRLVDQLRGAVLAASAEAGPDPAAQVRASVECTVRYMAEDARRARVLYVEALGSEALNRRRIEAGLVASGLLQEDTYDRQGPPPAGERIGQITSAVLVGGFSEVLMAWVDGSIDVTAEQLIDDATELFVALGEAAARIAERRAAITVSTKPAAARRPRKRGTST